MGGECIVTRPEAKILAFGSRFSGYARTLNHLAGARPLMISTDGSDAAKSDSYCAVGEGVAEGCLVWSSPDFEGFIFFNWSPRSRTWLSRISQMFVQLLH